MQQSAHLLHEMATGRQADLLADARRHQLIKQVRAARSCPRTRLAAAVTAAVRRLRTPRARPTGSDRPAVA